jgi:hypothetical protein
MLFSRDEMLVIRGSGDGGIRGFAYFYYRHHFRFFILFWGVVEIAVNTIGADEHLQ